MNAERKLSQLNRLIETGVPGQLSWGFVSGFSAGYCIKKVSKVAAFALGGMFIFVQVRLCWCRLSRARRGCSHSFWL
jgi:uncharacterized membrane protein (Fun14 family)